MDLQARARTFFERTRAFSLTPPLQLCYPKVR